MLEKVRGIIFRYNMLAAGDRVGIGVSGGADSVCLLRILAHLAQELHLDLVVLHLNHSLRGLESDGDQIFVESLAAELGLKCVSATVDLSKTPGNLEQAGRSARYEFFERAAADHSLQKIATGHTRGDQAETVIYRLLRGSGTAGLAGVRPVSGNVVRPLLWCERPEIESYLRAQGHPWREDGSNGDLALLRNRVRHELLPLIQAQYSPAVTSVLANTAEIARAEEDFWSDLANREFERLFEKKTSGFVASADKLTGIGAAVLRRVLRRGIQLIKGDLRGIDISHVESVVQLTRLREGSGRVQLPGVDAWYSFGWVRLAPLPRGTRADRDYCYPVTIPGEVTLPGLTLSLDVVDIESLGGVAQSYNETCGSLDFDLLDSSLELRNWRPGDKYKGASGSEEKIKELFQRSRIPIWERQSWPVLISGGVIVWSRLFGASADAAPRDGTRRLLRIRETSADVTESKRPFVASH